MALPAASLLPRLASVASDSTQSSPAIALRTMAPEIAPVESFEDMLSNLRQTPHPKTLVTPTAAGLGAVLVQQFDRRSPIERCALEIQRAPVAVLAIKVGLPAGKRGRDHPAGAGTPEIPGRAFDIRE